MKYEAVFGSQVWFEHQNNEYVVAFEITHDDESTEIQFDTEYPKKLKSNESIIAMRRIIQEPNRWTVADQKAGRLPEVGAKCRQGHKDEIVVAVTEKFVVTECQDMSVCTTRKDVFMHSYNPIETLEEKAQREEDEFVASVIDLASENQLMSCGFKDGVISAYRKLKGGE